MSHGTQQLSYFPLSRGLDELRMPALVAIAYYLAAEAAFYIGTFSDKIFAPFWPPNTILFCAFLFVPTRHWWRYILAAFPAHVISELSIGMGALQLLVAFVTNCLVSALNATAVQAVLDGPPWFNSLRKASLYILITGLLSPAIAAFAGAFVRISGGGAIQNYLTYWMQWYAANALASLTLGPIALIWLSETWKFVTAVSVRQRVEGVVLGTALVAVCIATFDLSSRAIPSSFLPTVLYLPMPLILWSAIRFGAKGASMAILIVTVVLLWRTLNGPSMFGFGNPEENVFAIQVFLIALAVPVLLLGSSIDETRHAERIVRDSEERIAFAAASSNIGLWQFDRQTDIFWATDHCRAMLGFRPDEPITLESIINSVQQEDRQIALDSILLALHSDELTYNEIRILLPDGTTRWFRVRARAQNDERGDPVLTSGIFVDATEHKIIENEAAVQRRELAHLTRVSMLGELSGGIAHELTQPLTAILSNAQAARIILTGGTDSINQVGQILDDIIEEDNRAGEVIHRLRGLFKKGEAKFEPIDLNEIVHSTLRLLHSELINHRIKIENALANRIPVVSGDPVQLQQVLLNLIMNAVDAMSDLAPSRRTIIIRTNATAEGGVSLSVTDRGIGLAHIDRDHLFQPFFTTKERGLGLGLSICLSIIKSHGGTFTLEENTNGGAIANFKLPGQNIIASVA